MPSSNGNGPLMARPSSDLDYMRLALRLAKRGRGTTSPNPMVGAVLVKAGRIIGRGWHRRAGLPHAEIEAIRDAERHGHSPRGAALFVTLEPCSTHGRTPPCTEAIISAGIRRVVVGTVDPNPAHRGKGLVFLRRSRIKITEGVLAHECEQLNEVFNFWKTHRKPFVVVKAATTLDGKIATASGESKWITGPSSRDYAMKLRQNADAVLVGINTVLADDPQLSVRMKNKSKALGEVPRLRRIVLDANARTPVQARVVTDPLAHLTTIVVSRTAPRRRVEALAKRVRVLKSPARNGLIQLPWLLKTLGKEEVTSLLVEGGGEVNGSFLLSGLAQRVAFFYAPKILGGAAARKAVGGEGVKSLKDALSLREVRWRRLGRDWLLTASVVPR
jgi:diaminohydroxyphosphoribosylaminopyrimidine deaminase/5-amino-6-(5-phosphoribosylamino)uracil reductase